MPDPFDGFEKSAPKEIPSTRPGAPGEAGEVRRRRVVDDELVEGMVIPPVPLADPIEDEVISAFDDEIEELDEAPAPRPRKRVPTDPPRAATTTTHETPRARLESAWDAGSISEQTPMKELARVFIDHTESMLSRILEQQLEIVRLQQKMVDRLRGDNEEFGKKDVVFVGLVLLVLVTFVVLYLTRG